MRKQQFEQIMKQARELSLMGASKDLIKHFFNDFGVNVSSNMLDEFVVKFKI